ncbi:GNAT family N-acetyltransferase [Rhizobium grahamii]|uniref:GNAT family N-acetyltransferase n=1 Tax=Rhizobium grahamii TaxID=1120045 RepID=UPI0034E0E074
MTPIGSVSCRLNSKTYPVVLRPEHSKEGYIWSVFTDPACRGKGVARKLLAMAIKHLERCECTAVVLHASNAGRPLYAGLGFEPASEMRLKFESATDLKPASVAIPD